MIENAFGYAERAAADDGGHGCCIGANGLLTLFFTITVVHLRSL